MLEITTLNDDEFAAMLGAGERTVFDLLRLAYPQPYLMNSALETAAAWREATRRSYKRVKFTGRWEPIALVRVRARLALGAATKAYIIHAGELGWRSEGEIRWDSHPDDAFIGLYENSQYELVADLASPGAGVSV